MKGSDLKAKCIANTGNSIAEQRILNTGDLRTSKYPVKLDRSYEIFGVLINRYGLGKFLVCDDESEPVWIPTELFEISDSSVRSDWHLNIDLEAYIPTKLGYKRLVSEIDHFEGIIEGHENDLVYFFQLKEKWKKEQELNLGV